MGVVWFTRLRSTCIIEEIAEKEFTTKCMDLVMHLPMSSLLADMTYACMLEIQTQKVL